MTLYKSNKAGLEWRMIEEFAPYYEVNQYGQVRSLGGRSGSKKKILKQQINNEGYPLIELTKNKKRHGRFVHRLVANAFLPNPDNKPQVNHIDFNPLNSHVSNLEWCTPKENVQHTIKAGRAAVRAGESNGSSKLNDEKVRQIRKLHGTMFNRDLAKMFGVTSRAIEYVVYGKRWNHVK